ncbi:MAG: carboxypeptidase-like regulatory domain-containing protein, partial [Acidobacteria bacterium]|nr:carboxypeptidase-like regulatory domain-containing protein [Acidobacteriota bacterium]
MKRNFIIRVVLITVTLIGLGWVVGAQSSNGSLRGVVQDQTRAVIPAVAVLLVNQATGVEFRAVSNDAGIYVFPAITPGTYRIVAEHPGMARYEATATVEPQTSATIDVVLKPSGTQTLVSVQDVTPMISTDSAAQIHTLERTRIEQLPLNGRSIWGLLQTVPGMTTEGGRLRVYGLRQGTHDVILDGAALTDYLDGAGAVSRLPSLDSIQEFTVANNASSAKFTRPGTIVYLTKGGSNTLHGSLFVTNRNSGYGVARARNNMTNVIPQLNRNEYGGTVGGPILIPRLYNGKNRSFFFFAYAGLKLRQSTYKLYRVPTEAMRNGDFSGLVNSAGTFFPIYNPWTTNSVTYQRQPFNYGGKLNRIDPSLISPLAKFLYSIIPMPNIAGANPLVTANYSGLAPNITDQFTWSMRFDQRFSDRDQFFVRMTNSLSNNYQPASNGVPLTDGFGNSVTTRYPNKSLATTWTHSFTPTLFAETMFSASRVRGSSFSGTPGVDYASQLGLPNPTRTGSYPVIADIGMGAGGNYISPINWKMQWYNYFILEENFTKIWGRHELQFGLHLRYDQLNSMPQHSYTAGGLTFPASATGLYDPSVPNRTSGTPNAGHIAASAYLGLANYEYRVSKGMYYMRGWEDAQYFQDNFRATSRLTLNLGVRWQITPYAKAKDNVFSSFDRKTMSIVLGRSMEDMYALGATSPELVGIMRAAGAKFARPEDVGMPSGLVYNEWRDVGPHLGFAYRALDGRKSFVVRGGYATTFFPLLIHGWADPMRANAPFAATYYNN